MAVGATSGNGISCNSISVGRATISAPAIPTICSASPIIRTLERAPIHSASLIAMGSLPKIRNKFIPPTFPAQKTSPRVLGHRVLELCQFPHRMLLLQPPSCLKVC